MKGLYIHVPFCKCRCIYCDFYSTTFGEEMRSRYVEVLCAEIEARRLYGGEPELSSVYLGGGTPSQLTRPELLRIFNCIAQHFTVAPNAEITLEANPDDVTPAFISTLLRTPVNRVSLGVQSLNDEKLRMLRRRHSAEQVRTAVALLHSAGYKNLSIDLIYGLPGQSLADWERDLDEALQFPVTHLSAYALIYEEGTALEAMRRRGEVEEAAEELSLEMYGTLMDKAQVMGFEHYEISNFARPGMEARHNSSYWNGLPYLGCGPGAHSFDGETRQLNFPDLQAYIAHPGQPPCETERLSENERFNELILTSLRTKKGLSLAQLEATFGSDARRFVLDTAASHLRSGALVCEDGVLKLSRTGLFISDTVMSDLMRVD